MCHIARFENNKNLYRFTDTVVQSSLAKGTGHKAVGRKRNAPVMIERKSGTSSSFRFFLQQAVKKRQTLFANQKYKVANSDTVWADVVIQLIRR